MNFAIKILTYCHINVHRNLKMKTFQQVTSIWISFYYRVLQQLPVDHLSSAYYIFGLDADIVYFVYYLNNHMKQVLLSQYYRREINENLTQKLHYKKHPAPFISLESGRV